MFRLGIIRQKEFAENVQQEKQEGTEIEDKEGHEAPCGKEKLKSIYKEVFDTCTPNNYTNPSSSLCSGARATPMVRMDMGYRTAFLLSCENEPIWYAFRSCPSVLLVT